MDKKPLGNDISQYLMKGAIPFGIYFIAEYLVRNYSASYLMLGFLNIPMMIGTVIILYIAIKKLRDKLMDGKIYGFAAWTFGTQLMLFAGLIEATFIYIFNEYISPTNLVNVHEQMILQYQEVLAQVESLPEQNGLVATATETMRQSINLLKETPINSAIETAVNMLTQDIFAGMILMLFIAPMLKKK